MVHGLHAVGLEDAVLFGEIGFCEGLVVHMVLASYSFYAWARHAYGDVYMGMWIRSGDRNGDGIVNGSDMGVGMWRTYSLIMRLPNLLPRKLAHPVVSARRGSILGHEARYDERHGVCGAWGDRR